MSLTTEFLHKSKKKFDDNVGLRPHFAKAYYDRARYHSYTRNLNLAIKDYNAALHLEPKPLGYYYRGIAHLEKGDIDRALADFQKVDYNDLFASTEKEPNIDLTHRTMKATANVVKEFKTTIENAGYKWKVPLIGFTEEGGMDIGWYNKDYTRSLHIEIKNNHEIYYKKHIDEYTECELATKDIYVALWEWYWKK